MAPNQPIGRQLALDQFFLSPKTTLQQLGSAGWVGLFSGKSVERLGNLDTSSFVKNFGAKSVENPMFKTACDL